MNDNILRLKDISKDFSSRTLFSDFSYDFKVGCSYVLQGYSGCGKTTLLSIIASFTKPTSGTITFNDEIDYKEHVSYLPAENAIYMHLSVIENLKMVSKDESKIQEVLNRVSLTCKDDELGKDLSKGEMVRLAIARIILEDRFIMLFDEPTGNLDLENTTIIFKLLNDLSKDHIVIISSHDQLNITDNCTIFEYDDGKFLYEEKEKEDISVDKNLKSDKIKNKRIYKRFIYDIFSNCFKQTIFIFLVVTCLCFFCNYFICYVQNDANTYIYNQLKSASIMGTLTLEDPKVENYTASCSDIFFENDNDNSYLAIYNDNNLFKTSNRDFKLDDNSIIIPESISFKFNINESDKVKLVIYNTVIEASIKSVYEVNSSIESLSFYCLLSDTDKEEISFYNTPIFISNNLIPARPTNYKSSYYYCSSELFSMINLLNYSPRISSFLSQGSTFYYWSGRKEEIKWLNYIFLAGIIVHILVIYIYTSTLCNSFKNEIKLSRLIYGNNNFSFKHIAISISLFTLVTVVLGFIISIAMFPFLTSKISSLYDLQNNVIPIFEVTLKGCFEYILIIFIFYLISLVFTYINTYILQKRMFKKNI